ncbi:MAG: hypothetical protein Sapg2KO_26480 [Saprospiraceae bacterium]
MKNILLVLAIFSLAFVSCKSTQNTTQQEVSQRSANERGPGGQQGGPPNVDQILAQMDTNKDGKLTKAETKGPLVEMFSTIDTNKDGFLSKEELEKAPKPQRGPRG